jgi:hypothetical protein
MHNIWLQQLKKHGTSLYTMIYDDYVRFLNNPLYIDITCKEVFPGMVLIGMNFYI